MVSKSEYDDRNRPDNILTVEDLYKYYGDIKAVNGISFEVRRGSFFAFLGKNGAGKSTTIKIITHLLSSDKGNLSLNGKFDEAYIRKVVGVVFQDNVLDNFLTVKENLLSRAIFYFKNKQDLNERYDYLVKTLELKEIENQKFKTLSGGQKRRVEIARALFAKPEILILDEPTTGLDPETRKLVWKIIFNLQKEESITIFLTTHYMEEAANADYVVIIDKGKIVAEGSPALLKENYSRDYFKVVPYDKNELIKFLEHQKRIYNKISDQYYIEIKSTKDTLDLISDLKNNIKAFEVINGTLDDVFIKVVGEENE